MPKMNKIFLYSVFGTVWPAMITTYSEHKIQIWGSECAGDTHWICEN